MSAEEPAPHLGELALHIQDSLPHTCESQSYTWYIHRDYSPTIYCSKDDVILEGSTPGISQETTLAVIYHK